MRLTRAFVPSLTPSHSPAWRQRLRFALGMLQMFGAVFTLVVIVETGFNRLSLAATVLTCGATSLSVLLFGRRSP